LQLDKNRIHYRPSMVKVKRSSDLRGFQSVNSLEVLTTWLVFEVSTFHGDFIMFNGKSLSI
jgi:hypothetical protein